MSSLPLQETTKTLRKAFDELNASLSNPYNESHLPLLRDLFVQHIFLENKHVVQLPWTENDMQTRNEEADDLVTTFFKAYVGALWPDRNTSLDREEMLGNAIMSFIFAIFDIEAKKWEARGGQLVLIEKLKVLGERFTDEEIELGLDQAFDRLDATLGYPYTEVHQQPLVDLIIETIFFTLKSTFALPIQSSSSEKTVFRVDIVARTFIDWDADEIWPNRDRSPSREQRLKYDVTDHVMWTLRTNANTYEVRLAPLELVKKLKVVGKQESVQRWIDQLPSPYAVKSLRETKSDIGLSTFSEKCERYDRHVLITGKPRKSVSMASVEEMVTRPFTKLD